MKATPMETRLIESSEHDRAYIAQALADAAYQRAYQGGNTPQAMRTGTAAVTAHSAVRQAREDVRVRCETLAGVPCEWLLPPAVRADIVPADQPLIVYLHGGGFVRGSLNLGRANAAQIAASAGLPVLAVGYRQAPEHPYPAAPDDVLAVYQALRSEARTPTSMTLVGESAGGTLALGMLPRLQGLGEPAPAAIAAVSPMADLALSGASWIFNAPQDVADLPTGRRMVELYLGSRSPADARISPVLHDYAGACPLWIAIGSHETMLSDAERLARRAAETGAQVHFRVYAGVPHGFTRFNVPIADQALNDAAAWCRDQLG